MLKFFFNRSSLIVRSFEVVGLILSIFIFKSRLSSGGWLMRLYLLVCVFWVFLHVCVWIRWYPSESRGRGIEVHFRKMLVPAAYLVVLTSLLLLVPFFLPAFFALLFANLIFGIMVFINVSLIYFYFQDQDPMPVNFFSANRYLNEELPTSHP